MRYTTHNVMRLVFAEPRARGSRSGSVLVRTFRTQHNIHPRTDRGNGTSVSLGMGERLDPILLIRCNDNEIERPVQPALVGPHPFYPDVYSPPPALELVTVPFVDRPQVELPTVAEPEPGPELSHSAGV